jgi:hypothetical protein
MTYLSRIDLLDLHSLLTKVIEFDDLCSLTHLNLRFIFAVD